MSNYVFMCNIVSGDKWPSPPQQQQVEHGMPLQMLLPYILHSTLILCHWQGPPLHGAPQRGLQRPGLAIYYIRLQYLPRFLQLNTIRTESHY